MHVDDAILRRRSIRAFRSDPVPLELVREILALAARAPSGTNIQPWKTHVVIGAARDRLVAEMLAERNARGTDGQSEFPRPGKRKDPYLSRMRALGKEMYGILGVPKGDAERSWREWTRNYLFFDAPVGLIFTVDKDLAVTSWLDIGIYIQTIMLAAEARGLGTCAQGAWNQNWEVTKRCLGVPPEDYICCGMSLGYPRGDAPINNLKSEREDIDTLVKFHL